MCKRSGERGVGAHRGSLLINILGLSKSSFSMVMRMGIGWVRGEENERTQDRGKPGVIDLVHDPTTDDGGGVGDAGTGIIMMCVCWLSIGIEYPFVFRPTQAMSRV